MHEQVLTKGAASLIPLLRRFRGYYLVGGTALALQIGHRISVDFDLFSPKELPRNISQRIKRVFSGYPITATYAVGGEQINLIIKGVKATFFYYPYPVLEPFVEYRGIPLAAIPEIAAMKAFSIIGKRIAYKDYVDWYFLLHDDHITIKRVIGLARKKYGGDFNDRLFLGQLASLEDVPTQKIDFVKDEIPRETIGNFLKKAVKGYMC